MSKVFIIRTSQVPGKFFSAGGMRNALFKAIAERFKLNSGGVIVDPTDKMDGRSLPNLREQNLEQLIQKKLNIEITV